MSIERINAAIARIKRVHGITLELEKGNASNVFGWRVRRDGHALFVAESKQLIEAALDGFEQGLDAAATQTTFIVTAFTGEHGEHDTFQRTLGVCRSLKDGETIARDALAQMRACLGTEFDAHVEGFGGCPVRATAWQGTKCLGQFDFINDLWVEQD